MALCVCQITAMDELLTTAEAAERLGIDRSTLTRWVQLGRINPAARLRNGVMLWSPEVLDAHRNRVA
jgi:excisionase family DNA binding protein